MAVVGNQSMFILSLLVGTLTIVSSAGIPVLNETQRSTIPIDCTTFNASVPCQFPNSDQRYCMDSGFIVTGLCAVQTAVCLRNMSVQTDFSLCTNSISDPLPQRPQGAVASSASTSEPPTVTSGRTSFNADGSSFNAGQAAFQFAGAPPTSDKTISNIEGETSTPRGRESSTLATLFGSNSNPAQTGTLPNTGTMLTNSSGTSLSSNGTPTNMGSTQSATTRETFTNNGSIFNTSGTSLNNQQNPVTDQATFTNNNTFNVTGTSPETTSNQFSTTKQTFTNNENTFNTSKTSLFLNGQIPHTFSETASSNNNTFNTSETPLQNGTDPLTNNQIFTSDEKTFNTTATSLHNDHPTFTTQKTSTTIDKEWNMNGTSFSKEQIPVRSSGTQLTNQSKNASTANAASFSNNKPFGSDQTPSNEKTLGDGGFPANGNSTASILPAASWHVLIASLSFATFSVAHQLIL